MNQDNRIYVDLGELGKDLGCPYKELEHDGTIGIIVDWKPEDVSPLAKAVKKYVQPKKIITYTGHTNSWIFSAVVTAVRPCPASLYIPELNVMGDMPTPPIGTPTSEGGLEFEIEEKNGAVFLRFGLISTGGHAYGNYDSELLKKIILPEIPKGCDLFVRGLGPQVIPATIALGYADHCRTISFRYHFEKMYTCAVSNTPDVALGAQYPCNEVCDEIVIGQH